MWIHTIERLHTLILSVEFKKAYAGLDHDAVLNQRDQPPFESVWLKNFDAVQAHGIDAAQSAAIDSLREATFKIVYSLTQHAELAAAVTDDFELIARYSLTEQWHHWPITHLLTHYRQGQFPC